ncbi:MAG: HEAT repeat domain-containing protein [Candidatus Riflebacteria bacterium]
MTKTAVLMNIQPLIARLINNFLVGEYDLRRESAIALSKFKGEKATDFLLETYESDNIQDFMALALGNIDNAKSVGLLINALNDSQQEVRFNAARALGMLENPEAFDILMEALNTYIETGAGTTLPAEGEGIEGHSSQLFFEEDAIIGAIIAIGKIKNWRAISLLKKLLGQEKSARIRASIIMALGMMASDKLMPVFQSSLRDEDPRVRANAIEAIEVLKSGSIVGILQPYLEDPSNRVRANVAKAIWKYGDFEVSQTLQQMLTHKDKWYRASAAYAIGETGDAKFLRQLSQALKDEDPDVRRNATNAIRKLELKTALPHVRPMLNDPNFDVRVEAALAITRCAPDEALEILKEKLPKEENFIVQATLISCLGQLGELEVLELIMPYLESEDPRVISNTIDAVSKITREPEMEFVQSINNLLRHDDNRVKSTAIRNLWGWGKYDVLDNLNSLFTSDDKKMVLSATFVLGEIGKEISLNEEFSKSVNEILTNLLEDPDAIRQAIGGAPKQDEPTPSTKPTEPELPDNAEPVKPTEKAKPEVARFRDKLEKVSKKTVQPPEPPQEPIITPQIIADTRFSDDIELANEYITTRNFDSAEKIYKSIYTAEPKHLKNLLAYANLCFMQKRNTEAADLYNQALEINPNIVKALFNLGTICFYNRKYESAVNYLAKALQLYPKILGAYLILAQIYQIAGKYGESIKLLSHAVTLSPRNPVIYQKLSALHIQLRQYDEAVKVLKRAVEISPADVESRLILGYCLGYCNKYQDAFVVIDSAIKAAANSTNPDISFKQLHKAYLFLNQILEEQKMI